MDLSCSDCVNPQMKEAGDLLDITSEKYKKMEEASKLPDANQYLSVLCDVLQLVLSSGSEALSTQLIQLQTIIYPDYQVEQ